ncbi:hypothetical protein [Pseudosulfitobacter pseudonitzschiae]|uniref:hypothetical protein n=1 Tax=Pseudosulfitobacter pseudonitzschiae TaxID=1402135 RepID=UPI003B7D7CFF
MQYPYTKLFDTDLWRAAEAQYRMNGHDYHGMGHIHDLYASAARLGMDYDVDLDHAILTHDVILDGEDRPELRSARWLELRTGNRFPKASELIMTTVDHLPSHDDNRMALLDLSGFLSPGDRTANTRKLRDEAARKKGVSFNQLEWAKGAMGYLKGLHERIDGDLSSTRHIQYEPQWRRIRHGIACTMTTLPLNYAPHPAQGIQRYTRDQEAVLLRLYQSSCTVDQIKDFCEDAEIKVERVPAILARLTDEWLISKPGSGPLTAVSLSDIGVDWCQRMTTPEETFSELEI